MDEQVAPEETVVNIVATIEAVIFASGSPIDEEKIGAVTGFSENDIAEGLLEIRRRYQETDGGIELVQLGDKFQFRTKPQFAEMLQRLKEEKPKRLSTAALETLAIVAYRQPIIKSDVEGIRGVDATPTIKTLLERNLIKIVGHQQTVGSPALYATTDEFLKLFSLGSLAELPTLRDLAPLEEDPGENEDASVDETSGDDSATLAGASTNPSNEADGNQTVTAA